LITLAKATPANTTTITLIKMMSIVGVLISVPSFLSLAISVCG
jgi:hypothetical protein